MTNIYSAAQIAKGTRVQPSSEKVAGILANNTYFKPGVGLVKKEGAFIPSIGTVEGHTRGGDYCLVRWDGDPCSTSSTVAWGNLRPEGGEPYYPGRE